MEKVEGQEVKLQANADSSAEDWQIAINEARGTGVYTEGSMGEGGVVGADWYVEGGNRIGGGCFEGNCYCPGWEYQ